MNLSRRIAGDAIKYSTSNYISNVFTFVTSLIMRRVLGPATMGIFAALMLVYQYARNYHLGVLDALDREIPIFNGRKDFSKVEKLKNVGFTATVLTSLLVSVGLIVYSFFCRNRFGAEFIIGLRILAILLVAQALIFFYIVLLRTHHQFSLLSRYTFFISIIDAGFKIFMIIKFGLYGLMCAFLLTAVVGIFYFLKTSGHQFRIELKSFWDELFRLLCIGFPMLLSGFVFMTMTNIDKLSILMFLGKTNLGYYTIATMMFEFVFMLPNVVYAVLFPRFYEAYARNKEISTLKYFFVTPTLLFAYLYSILIGVIVLILPLLVHYILPKFQPGLRAAEILLLGTFSLSIMNMSCYTLIALNKQMRMVFIGIFAIMIGVILNFIFVKKMGLGLIGAAQGMVVTYFIYTVILIIYAFRYYTKKVFEHLKFLSSAYFPLAWIIAVLWVLNMFFPVKFLLLPRDIFYTLVKGIIFLIAASPLVIYINQKTGILAEILKKQPASVYEPKEWGNNV